MRADGSTGVSEGYCFRDLWDKENVIFALNFGYWGLDLDWDLGCTCA